MNIQFYLSNKFYDFRHFFLFLGPSFLCNLIFEMINNLIKHLVILSIGKNKNEFIGCTDLKVHSGTLIKMKANEKFTVLSLFESSCKISRLMHY